MDEITPQQIDASVTHFKAYDFRIGAKININPLNWLLIPHGYWNVHYNVYPIHGRSIVISCIWLFISLQFKISFPSLEDPTELTASAVAYSGPPLSMFPNQTDLTQKLRSIVGNQFEKSIIQINDHESAKGKDSETVLIDNLLNNFLDGEKLLLDEFKNVAEAPPFS